MKEAQELQRGTANAFVWKWIVMDLEGRNIPTVMHSLPVHLCAVLLITMTVFMHSCAMARGVHEPLPPAQNVGILPPIPPGYVQLIKEGQQPKLSCIRIASVAAHGNGYASRETLEAELVREAAMIGADTVVVTELKVSTPMVVGTYGGGITTSQPINTPSLYGVACKSSKVALGIFRKKDDWTIEYVRPGSLAEKIGLREGMKLLSVNGIYLPSDQYAFEREVLSKQPGDKIILEYKDLNGTKIQKEVTLEEVPNR